MVCTHCDDVKACRPRAELQCVASCRDVLQAEYGWDIFSMIAEARHQYILAKENNCPSLGEVKRQAAMLAPQVDFDRV
jgi:hypothetical protein